MTTVGSHSAASVPRKASSTSFRKHPTDRAGVSCIKDPRTERASLKFVGADAEPAVRALVEYLAEIAAQQRPTLRKNLTNLLVALVEHPEDTALIGQTVAGIERFFTPPAR